MRESFYKSAAQNCVSVAQNCVESVLDTLFYAESTKGPTMVGFEKNFLKQRFRDGWKTLV